MADQNDVDLDSIIDRLLEVRGSRPGKQVQLLETEIRFLCTKAREIFITQPILLELEAPIKVSNQRSLNSTAVERVGSNSLTPLQSRRFVGTFTANITTCYVSSNMAVSHRKQTTSSWATT